MGVPALPARFWAKVDTSGHCWTWMAGKFGNGYPAFCVQGVNRPAHRVAYEALVGAIPEGRVIDHLCGNPLCVNPSHLEAVTQRTNVLRGNGFASRHAKKTHCPKGHEYTPENTRIYRGMRNCRECARIKDQARKEQGYFRDYMRRRRAADK